MACLPSTSGLKGTPASIETSSAGSAATNSRRRRSTSSRAAGDEGGTPRPVIACGAEDGCDVGEPVAAAGAAADEARRVGADAERRLDRLWHRRTAERP